MPAPVAEDMWDTLTARAKATQDLLRAGAGTDPGLDALRVDALVDAVLGPTTRSHTRDQRPGHNRKQPATAQVLLRRGADRRGRARPAHRVGDGPPSG